MTTLVLPYPKLAKGRFASTEAYSDEALLRQRGFELLLLAEKAG